MRLVIEGGGLVDKSIVFSLFLGSQLVTSTLPATAEEGSEEGVFSRQELYFVMREVDLGTIQFALPQKFSFPANVRPTSTFGIDISNNNERACNCALPWQELLSRGVEFIYLKATEGATYTDQTYLRSIATLRRFQASGAVHVGAYHFLTSTAPVQNQIDHFTNIVQEILPQDLPPSLDLEWNLGGWTDDCPANATVRIKRPLGEIVKRCDMWYTVKGVDIIDRANKWLDAVRLQTKREPIVYTNSAWWDVKIGDPSKINELHTKLIWIADYSKGGLGTEKPRVPSNHSWKLWQFSETATIGDGTRDFIVDASIYEGNVSSLKADLGIQP